MGLFSKTVDYNSELEDVLDKKRFSASIKSLLLSMIYKVEISYKDYAKVKKYNKSKNEFLTHIIQNIYEYFETVKVVEPGSEEAKILKKNKITALTNEVEKSVLCYPTEASLLYGVADIEPKYFYIDNYIFKKEFQNILVEGSNLNVVEVIEDFTGWSWNPKSSLDKNFFSNIIYQNLIMMFGYEFMDSCKSSPTTEFDIIKALKRNYREYYKNLTLFLYVKNKNKRLDNKLSKIIKELSEKDESSKFESQIELYKSLLETNKTLDEAIIELQKSFIKILYKKSKNIQTKEQFLDMMYKIRYYRNISFNKDKSINNIEELNVDLNKLLKVIITFGTKNAFIKMVSFNIALNAKILSGCLDTKSMEMDNLKISIDMLKNTLLVEVFENKIFEKRFSIQYASENPDLTVKKKKAFKVFI